MKGVNIVKFRQTYLFLVQEALSYPKLNLRSPQAFAQTRYFAGLLPGRKFETNGTNRTVKFLFLIR